LDQIKNLRPAPRPQFTAALQTAAAAPACLTLLPTEKFRQELSKQLPPMLMGQPSTTLWRDVQWIALAASPPPNPQVNLVIDTANPTAAKGVSSIILTSFVMLKTMHQPDPRGRRNSDIALLTDLGIAASQVIAPVVQGNQVIIALDDKALGTIARAAAPAVLYARAQSMRAASMSNIRQILQACLIYSNQHNGAWPTSLKDVDNFFQGQGRPQLDRIMTNPAHPELKPAYVYIKPDNQYPGPRIVVIYESHTDFGPGVSVGFADGHVEFISDEKTFNEFLLTADAAGGGL
jgi:prepilin-type processing-associated H-X9-DG protein